MKAKQLVTFSIFAALAFTQADSGSPELASTMTYAEALTILKTIEEPLIETEESILYVSESHSVAVKIYKQPETAQALKIFSKGLEVTCSCCGESAPVEALGRDDTAFQMKWVASFKILFKEGKLDSVVNYENKCTTVSDGDGSEVSFLLKDGSTFVPETPFMVSFFRLIEP